jgi:hypothetical protein
MAEQPIDQFERRPTDGDNRRNSRLHEGLLGESDDRILGFTMLGAEAREVMAVVQTAMLASMPYTGHDHRAPDHGRGPQ